VAPFPSPVSIGEDGPSQMGLEDIGMFAAEPNFTVLYPSDATSAWAATTLAAEVVGPTYIRLGRPNNPIIYGPEGSGANSELSQIQWVLRCWWESGSGYAARAACPDLRHRCRESAKLAHLKLFLLDLLCQLDAADYHRRRPQALQSQHRAQPLFDAPVVLFDEVVQVFAGPYWHALRQLAITFPFRHRPVGGGVGVQGDFRGGPLTLHGLAQKAFRRVPVAFPTQMEIDRLPGFVHRSIQVHPFTAYLYICLVHPP
jgi:hypothetical protein